MIAFYQAPDLRMLVGDVRECLRSLPSESVHCVVSSPPYWGLRSYLSEGHPDKEHEIGAEPNVQGYVEHLVEVFREVKRVLRHDGTLWLNLGDSYVGGGHGPTGATSCIGHQDYEERQGFVNRRTTLDPGLKPKDLAMVPARVALALQADGWYLRSEITWCKVAPMPESVGDRPTSATERIYLLAKSESYFYDSYAVREPVATPGRRSGNKQRVLDLDGSHGRTNRHRGSLGFPYQDEDGFRNLRNYLVLPPEPFKEAHFAVYPTAIPRTAILAGTSEDGCCPQCGAPRVRKFKRTKATPDSHHGSRFDTGKTGANGLGRVQAGERTVKVPCGWEASCGCGYTYGVPCTVLDPFSGSGTTSLVARRLGRHSIYIDLNPKYAEIARERIEGQTPSLLAGIPA
jgi:DNA modification methylase